jgi:phosphogluconate dehydratase
MSGIHPVIQKVTERIIRRSEKTRGAYLDRIAGWRGDGVRRAKLPCSSLAHAFAACNLTDKGRLRDGADPNNKGASANLGIVTAYNDMLSAHQPFEGFPEIIKEAARTFNATAQVAGGVPAMCDGVTQGEPGGYLSLPSRDSIAEATAVALSHNVFDAAVYLGICDKIVPGLVIGAATFGHIPGVFIPAGPMPTGQSNEDKARDRALAAQGKMDRAALLASEGKSYHGPGTCTFYGTANTNQMLMEIMGLHIPDASFTNPNTPLRNALTQEATRRALTLTATGDHYTPIGHVLSEKAFVNGIVGLHATGGSTNLTIHMIAMAAAAGIKLNWQDMSDLSAAVPLLTRVYPNGSDDVNHFHKAGGMGFLISELLHNGMLHNDVKTVAGDGLENYCRRATLEDGKLAYAPAAAVSAKTTIVRPFAEPFSDNGGLKLLKGNLGKAIIKVSAIKEDRHVIEAPVRVFHTQDELRQFMKNIGEATEAVKADGGMIAVVNFNGPRANFMPELHKVVELLGILQDKGCVVGLVTDGRLSGASGKVPAAIHVTPEAIDKGPISKVRDGDRIRIDAKTGALNIVGSPETIAAFRARTPEKADLGYMDKVPGWALFAPKRRLIGPADKGAGTIRANFG